MNVLGIPSVEAVLEQPPVRTLLGSLRREVVVECVRACVAALREERRGECGVRSAECGAASEMGEAAALVAARVAERLRPSQPPSLRRVVNATGVIIHTNLGRAPLHPAVLAAITETARGYCNLEVDVASGERSKREAHVAGLLARLSGAEAATVANNNAAATLLTLTALAAGRRVICSRGELVEIGGSFRLPEVIACSGAQMVEVGTTNHTRLSDYEAALAAGPAAAILKVHRSNFRIVGFTSEPPLKDLAALAHRADALLILDAGSGLLLPNPHPVFAQEPVVRQAVAEGADIVTFSTDKLLGGPQGGAIVGREPLVRSISRHPLKRALRVGKLTLAGLEATLAACLEAAEWPGTVVMRLIHRPLDELEADAQALAKSIAESAPGWTAHVEPDESSVGGGSLPGETLPTAVVWLEAPGLAADELDRAFRLNEPPVFGRFRKGRFGLDLRTLLPGDAADIVACAGRLARARP